MSLFPHCPCRFSLFVAFVALVFGILQFTKVNDALFGVIWFLWAILWTLFFLLLALGKDSLNDFTGWFTIIMAHITGTIPALLLLSGNYVTGATEAIGLAVLGLLAIAAAYMLSRRKALSGTGRSAPASTQAH